jgi:hypothetical protein
VLADNVCPGAMPYCHPGCDGHLEILYLPFSRHASHVLRHVLRADELLVANIMCDAGSSLIPSSDTSKQMSVAFFFPQAGKCGVCTRSKLGAGMHQMIRFFFVFPLAKQVNRSSQFKLQRTGPAARQPPQACSCFQGTVGSFPHG